MKKLITTILVCVSLLSLNCEGGSPIPAEGDQYDISMFAIGLRVYFSRALPSAGERALFHHPSWKGKIDTLQMNNNFIFEAWRFNKRPFNDYLILPFENYEFTEEPTFYVKESMTDHNGYKLFDLIIWEFEIKGLPQKMPPHLAEWLSYFYMILPPGVFGNIREQIKDTLENGYIYDSGLPLAFTEWGDYLFTLSLGYTMTNSHLVHIDIERIAGNNSGNIMN